MRTLETLTANEYDAVALRIADRIRSSHELDDVLQYTLDELGEATGISRALIQLKPGEDGCSAMLAWVRGDTSPLDVTPPTPAARRVFETGRPFIVDDVAEADGDIAPYLYEVGAAAEVSYPIVWQGEVLAVIGFQDSEPRHWRDGALPLLQRLDAQLASALAQAELFRQQQAAIEELRRVDRLREELIATVSHELRTPLAGIIGAIKTLQRQDVGLQDELQRRLLEVMDGQSDRLMRLTGDLLQLARISRGDYSLELECVPLVELVEEAARELELPQDRTVDVKREGNPVVEGDRPRLHQVVSNLLLNAVKHGCGTVLVRVFTDAGKAVLVVSDEGEGVPAEHADEIFLAFSHRGGRVDSTGLGLSISRYLVEAHAGSLTYLPASDNGPHQFVVTLPLAN